MTSLPAAPRRLSRTLLSCTALALAGGALAACSTGSSLVAHGLPSASTSCTPANSVHAIPFAKKTTAAGPLVEVSVCLEGDGPYPFLVSTGAGQSVVAPSLKRSLKLTASAAPVAVEGATCTTSASTVTVRSFSMGGLALAPQDLVVADVPSFGVSPAPLGVIGSDVLARFGAVRVDYASKTITPSGAEGPAPSSRSLVIGQTNAPRPGTLLKSGPTAGAPMDVAESPTSTVMSTTVALGTSSAHVLVDTGSPSSAITTGTATTAHLVAGSGQAPVAGVGCSGSAPAYSSGTWSIGGAPLPSVSLVTESFPGPSNQGVAGALGADALSSFGSVVVDYSNAYLWLGAG